jgi:hypothetical protein
MINFVMLLALSLLSGFSTYGWYVADQDKLRWQKIVAGQDMDIVKGQEAVRRTTEMLQQCLDLSVNSGVAVK